MIRLRSGYVAATRPCVRRPAYAAPAVLAMFVLAGCGGGGGGGSTSLLPLNNGTHRATAATTAATVGGFGIADATSGSVSFSPLSLAWPKGAPAAGDLLVACAESQWLATPQTPAGWTALYAASANSFGSALFYKFAGSGEPATVVFSIPTPYNIGAAMVRVTGAAAVAPRWSHVANKNSRTIATGALVPNVVGMLPLACFGGVNAGSYAASAGWTIDSQPAAGYLAAIEHRTTLTTDTTTGISTTATSAATPTNSDAFGVLVAPATTATPPPPPPPSAPTVTDAASGTVSFAPLTLNWKKGAPASGDLLVACTEAQWQTTPQAPTGWTALYAASASHFGTGLFYRIAGAGEPASVAFTIPTPYNVSAAMVRISGAAARTPLWSYATNTNANTIATAAVVPNAAGMLPLACFGSVNGGALALAGGWTPDAATVSGYETTVGHRTSVTTDTVTGISTTANAAAVATSNDAYGILVAPASGGTSGGINVNPSAIAFTSVTAPAQTVAVTQAGTSAFSASTTTCNGIATIANNGNGQFSVAPVAVGACSFTLAGSGGQTVALPVTVTSTVITFH